MKNWRNRTRLLDFCFSEDTILWDCFGNILGEMKNQFVSGLWGRINCNYYRIITTTLWCSCRELLQTTLILVKKAYLHIVFKSAFTQIGFNLQSWHYEVKHKPIIFNPINLSISLLNLCNPQLLINRLKTNLNVSLCRKLFCIHINL